MTNNLASTGMGASVDDMRFISQPASPIHARTPHHGPACTAAFASIDATELGLPRSACRSRHFCGGDPIMLLRRALVVTSFFALAACGGGVAGPGGGGEGGDSGSGGS